MSKLIKGMVLACCLTAAGGVWAQSTANYPTGPIRLIIPFPPGGNVDTLARVVARQVEEQMGVQFVLDNRGGANGILGCDLAAKAQPNGYTILSTSFPLVVNHSLYRKLPYDTAKDFAPITNYVTGWGYVMVINPSVPAKNVKELIAYAKSQHDPLRFGSPGVGNGQHLSAELFALRTGIPLLHVPYKGGGPALTAVLSGEVHINFPSPTPVAPFLQSGKLRALGFTGAKRLPSMPNLPTLAEAGVKDYEFDAGWHGWFAPARTPQVIIDRLHAEIQKAIAVPKVREFLLTSGYEPRGDKPAEFRKIFLQDIDRYAEIVRAAKIEPQ